MCGVLQVRYFQRGENIYVATDVDAGKVSHKTISGFQINVVYELRVFGYSRGGDGLQSSPTLEFVLGMAWLFLNVMWSYCPLL